MNYKEKPMDPEVIPLVNYFQSIGLPTRMSCQGHNDTNMSMFWIEFARSVTPEDIIRFQRERTNKYGGFCCNGRFAIRILANTTGVGAGVEYSCQYMAATIEAAKKDLEHWKEMDSHKIQRGSN